MNSRQTAIIKLLGQDERISVQALAGQLGVSGMTIRRDLTYLEEQGYLIRTHGGGVSAGKLRFLQSAFPEHSVSPQKAAIGKLAAGLVKPGQTIMVDSGTTTLEVAANLPRDTGITIATVSLCVAQTLYASGVNVLVLGGYLRTDFPSLYGPLTERMLGDLRVDMVFMGCDGADSVSGFYTSDLHVSSLEQAMIKIADRVVVVTESHKFGKRAFVRFASPSEVHTLVTDPGLSDEDRKNLEKQGIRVLLSSTI